MKGCLVFSTLFAFLHFFLLASVIERHSDRRVAFLVVFEEGGIMFPYLTVLSVACDPFYGPGTLLCSSSLMFS
jgi:hypothetical protein